jgi:hypothetical protein
MVGSVGRMYMVGCEWSDGVAWVECTWSGVNGSDVRGRMGWDGSDVNGLDVNESDVNNRMKWVGCDWVGGDVNGSDAANHGCMVGCAWIAPR